MFNKDSIMKCFLGCSKCPICNLPSPDGPKKLHLYENLFSKFAQILTEKEIEY